MKVLDIISEGFKDDVAGYVWKYFGKKTIEHAVARKVVDDIASDIFNNYGKRGIEPPPGIVKEMLERHPSAAGLDDATKDLVKIEISRYYLDLKKKFASSGLPVKPGKAGVDDVARGVFASAWKTLRTVGLLNTVFYAWAATDIYDIVHTYHTNMTKALEAMDNGMSLAAFQQYHKQQLTQLLAQLLITKPVRFYGIPILGWIGRLLNTGPVRVAWLAFIDAKVIDGPDGKMSVRNYIDNLCLWSLKAVPGIGPFLPDVTISDFVGPKLEWTEDVIKEAWVDWLQNGLYKGKTVPESWMPPNYIGTVPSRSNAAPVTPAPPSAKPNAGTVPPAAGPAAADSQAGTDPSKNNDASPENSDPNWRDLGTGYEVHVHSGNIRATQRPNKK